MFYRAGLDSVLVHETPAEHPQEPPTEGPWPATRSARGEVGSVHDLIRDIHQHGSDDATYYRPEK